MPFSSLKVIKSSFIPKNLFIYQAIGTYTGKRKNGFVMSLWVSGHVSCSSRFYLFCFRTGSFTNLFHSSFLISLPAFPALGSVNSSGSSKVLKTFY